MSSLSGQAEVVVPPYKETFFLPFKMSHDHSSAPIRVRAVLSGMKGATRAALARLLPPATLTCAIGSHKTEKYPAAVLAAFPKGEAYGYLGKVAEELLHYRAPAITQARLAAVMQSLYPGLSAAALAKVAASKTTPPFLATLQDTARLLELHGGFDAPRYEPAIAAGSVVGHPDIVTAHAVFEVKLTGEPVKHWKEFLLQTFAYAALYPAATHVHIVLPLQTAIWTYDVRGWGNKAKYLTALQNAATAQQATCDCDHGVPGIAKGVDLDVVMGAVGGVVHVGGGLYLPTAMAYQMAIGALCDRFRIGSHISKAGGIAPALEAQDPTKPCQIFLGSNINTRVNIKPAEIAAVRAIVDRTKQKFFIHAPYLLNLCTAPEDAKDNYILECLKKQLEAAAAMGAAGVVVHVGKSATTGADAGLANQRRNLQLAASYATAECPLLLETPAGQGTETLRSWEEFFGLLLEINDPRLRACVDTCHVFACGHDPVVYVQRAFAECPGMVKLIHYNDSEGVRGSCVDRHALVGGGHIGMKPMGAIAEAAWAARVPCVIE